MPRSRLVTATLGGQGRRMTVQPMKPHTKLDDLYRTRTLKPLRPASTESAGSQPGDGTLYATLRNQPSPRAHTAAVLIGGGLFNLGGGAAVLAREG